MHVPLRKKTLEIPSPTEKDWLKKDEEEDFFLKDPDKMFDSLPQPVRMVSKLVNLLLERAWEEIEGKHPLLQETKQQKLSTALYQPSDEFEIAGTANCIVASRIYIFMGISTGLSVFSMLTSEQLCAWEAARLEINTIQISDLADSSYLLGTVDELGRYH
uniref:WD repeat domain 93 n=1 Tax=Salvator merianae TaxID=96440 RepID=A0A8D0ECV5_SALMN